MIPLSQSLPLAFRDALVMADTAPGGRLDAALLLPATAQGAAVTDGTSNTILFGGLVARPASRPEMARLWNTPGLLRPGFGLLLPAAAGPLFQAGLSLPDLQLLPWALQSPSPGTTAGGTRALKITGTVAETGGSAAAPSVVALWFAPLSIIAVLIAL